MLAVSLVKEREEIRNLSLKIEFQTNDIEIWDLTAKMVAAVTDKPQKFSDLSQYKVFSYITSNRCVLDSQ